MSIIINGHKVAGVGPAGLSPYQVATAGGYIGTEQEFNQQLVAVGGIDAALAGKVPSTRKVNGKALSSDISLTAADVGAAATSHGTHVTYGTAAPAMDGTAAVGTAAAVARSDHRHPTDTSRAAASHTHTKGQITDFPASLPASDVYAWAKATSKPGYTAAEVGAAAASHNQSASTITSGTLAIARGGTGQTTLTPDVTTRALRAIRAGSTDLVNGSSPLTTGEVYLVYESGE